MAFSVSFIAEATMRDAIKNTIALNWAGTSPDTFNVALFNNTVVPSPDTDPQTYGVAPWNANEVSGTGWAAGGVALASLTNTIKTGVGIQFSAGNVSQATTTLTAAQGAAYSTTAGTFAITWDGTNGIAYIDLTP
jgi:hypothetical protein